MGNGMSNFTAQNLGARRSDRVREGYRGCLKMMALIATAFAAVYVLLGDQVIRLFLNGENTQALSVGKQFLRVVAPFYYAVAMKVATDGVLRGAGRMGEFMTDTFIDLGPACGAVVCAFGASGPAGRMVELAGQLGGGHSSGHCILPAESLGQAGTRRCLSKRKKDEQNTCVFEERHVK